MKGDRLWFGAALLAVGTIWLAAEPAGSVQAAAPNMAAPAVAVKPAYETETWDDGRTLTWAKPGEGGAGGEPANWMEDGRPAMLPPDDEADLVLPDADKPYTVDFGTYSKFKARSITIGRDGHINSYGYELTGNLWVKAGASISAKKPAVFTGIKHTFVRNDNGGDGPGRRGGGGTTRIGQYITVNKYKGGSVEFVGHVTATDELTVNSGTAIIAPDAMLQAGPASVQTIGPEATLLLLSGAFFGKHTNNAASPDDIVVRGCLMAGSPDRPLTKDATLGVSFKKVDAGKPLGGLRVETGGRLQIHSQDPAKARLVIRWHGNGASAAATAVGRSAAPAPLFGITILGEADINGLLLDNVVRGGIRLPSLEARSKWKNVFFGDQNGAPPDELFSVYQAPAAPAKATAAPAAASAMQDSDAN